MGRKRTRAAVQPRHARARKMLQIQTNLRMWRFPDCLMFKFYNQFIYVFIQV